MHSKGPATRLSSAHMTVTHDLLKELGTQYFFFEIYRTIAFFFLLRFRYNWVNSFWRRFGWFCYICHLQLCTSGTIGEESECDFTQTAELTNDGWQRVVGDTFQLGVDPIGHCAVAQVPRLNTPLDQRHGFPSHRRYSTCWRDAINTWNAWNAISTVSVDEQRVMRSLLLSVE